MGNVNLARLRLSCGRIPVQALPLALMSFKRADLEQLDSLLSQAHAVVAMQEIHAGNTRPDVIGLRHDCDNAHSLDVAVKMAEWEAGRGYRSTYFLLHSSPYWDRDDFGINVERIAMLGHEIGLHTNALAEALRTGRDPDEILEDALFKLRKYGLPVRGVQYHGDKLCHSQRFVNDEQFVECARPKLGAPDRVLYNGIHGHVGVRLRPRPLADFGFDYHAFHLPKSFYQSDSGGRWAVPFEQTVEAFKVLQNAPGGQLHMLVHPDWWQEAF